MSCFATAAGNNEDASKDSSCPVEFPSHRREGAMTFYHYGSTNSTQDSAREIVEREELKESQMVIVTATEQTNGRGTSGRQWMGAKGNTFVTLGIRQQLWKDTGVAMTLLPLQMGIVMATRIKELVRECDAPSKVTVKWPNDVLVDRKKIAGVLIESTADWFLIGIGVNVAFAPQVPTQGPNQGRTATSVSDICGSNEDDYIQVAQTLGQDLGRDLFQWVQQASNPNTATQTLLQTWKEWVDWEMELVLRDLDDKTPVQPVDVEKDGRLKVRDAQGKERHVVSDYFL